MERRTHILGAAIGAAVFLSVELVATTIPPRCSTGPGAPVRTQNTRSVAPIRSVAAVGMKVARETPPTQVQSEAAGAAVRKRVARTHHIKSQAKAVVVNRAAN